MRGIPAPGSPAGAPRLPSHVLMAVGMGEPAAPSASPSVIPPPGRYCAPHRGTTRRLNQAARPELSRSCRTPPLASETGEEANCPLSLESQQFAEGLALHCQYSAEACVQWVATVPERPPAQMRRAATKAQHNRRIGSENSCSYEVAALTPPVAAARREAGCRSSRRSPSPIRMRHGTLRTGSRVHSQRLHGRPPRLLPAGHPLLRLGLLQTLQEDVVRRLHLE